MILVKEIILSDDSKDPSIVIGGSSVNLNTWPMNPDGKALVLIATIECASLKKTHNYRSIPQEGMLYIFSTYSSSDYFLDNITYSGDTSELESISSGYTLVAMKDSESEINSPYNIIPKTNTKFNNKAVQEDEYPVFSMLTNTPPNGVKLPLDLLEEYEFVMQLYSSDFPEPFKDIFYLTDAVGCLLLKKDGSGNGLFFVHTA
ncbi:YwqG family protein [Pseudomonas syringae]|nr:YwqG family protein [Pseudomonas syringae]